MIKYPLNFMYSSNHFWFYCLYTIVKLAGVVISIFLLWYELDKYNPVVKNLCTSSYKKINCSAVLNSKGAKLLGGKLTLSELGFTYFFSTIMLLLLSNFIPNSFNLLNLLSLASLPFVVLSLIYQGIILKQWCLLCTIVQLLLIIEISITIILSLYTLDINTDVVIVLFLFSIIPLLSFKMVKSFVYGKKAMIVSKRRFNRLKSNKEVFDNLLLNSKGISRSNENIGLNFVKNGAKNEVLKICNPYCPPCSRAHPVLHKMLTKGRISLRIIFTSRPDINNDYNLPSYHFMALKEEKPEILLEAIDFWYTLKEKKYELLSNKYPVTSLDKYNHQVEKMFNWCYEEKIDSTPTLFINGKQLPNLYDISDLNILLL